MTFEKATLNLRTFLALLAEHKKREELQEVFQN
jgi:hypothetical protein